MSFNIDNFGSDASNVKSILGGVCYYRYYNKDNNNVTVAGYFPASLGLQVGDRITVIPQTKTDADELYIVSDITNRVVTVTYIDTDGTVDSVNSKTGHVVLDANDVGAIAQYNTIPTASADELGNIYQFIGTTDANYTNGYFYKCVSDGADPATYSWAQVSVQPAPSGLPDQTGQSGKFLTTDGTDASWATLNALQNTAPQTTSVAVTPDTAAQDYSKATTLGVYASSGAETVSIGYGCIGGISTKPRKSVFIGSESTAGNVHVNYGVAIGYQSKLLNGSGIAIGAFAMTTADNAIQLGSKTSFPGHINGDANTFKVGNANGNFELMNANGNIPADRIASTTGLADGNYRLRLTMASGVPTLSWVAE